MSSLEKWGRELAEALDSGQAATPSEAQRNRLAEEWVRGSRSSTSRRPLLLGGMALAGALCAAVLWILPVGPDDGLTGTLSDGTELAVGRWLETVSVEQQIRFSDGSRVTLSADTRARLTKLDRDSVVISMASGTVRSRVRPKRRRRWRFEAGPYRVLVIGTQLSVRWDEGEQRLSVAVARGRVRVTGGRLAGSGVAVASGQRMSVDPDRLQLPAAPAVQVADGGSSADANPPPADATSTPQLARPRVSRALDRHWQRLARQGRYDAAVAEARRLGIARVVRRLSGDALLLLADAARLSGDLPAAKTALQAARRRYGKQHVGRIAVFRLGRIAFDQERDYAGAARLFSAFLRLAPRSNLAPDALGRKMLALHRMGDGAAARRAARLYTDRYPDGAYAASAQRILAEP